MNTRISEMSPEMLKAISASEQDALIDLYELDLRRFGGELLRFCNQINEKGEHVCWQGNRYTAYPIEASGFEVQAQGTSNRPKLSVSNVYGLVTGLAVQFNQLIGATVTRRQVMARFLDAVNFVNGNRHADPLQEIVSRYTIEQMTEMNQMVASFILATPSESDGAVIPCRKMMANVCVWQYRGAECGYAGAPVADRMDLPTSDPALDDCSKTKLGCIARFGATAVLPYGGFIAIDKVV